MLPNKRLLSEIYFLSVKLNLIASVESQMSYRPNNKPGIKSRVCFKSEKVPLEPQTY